MKISRFLPTLAALWLLALPALAADRYVSASGSTTSPYDTWAKASTTLQTAITGSAAGDRFLVDKTMAESIGSVQSLAFPGTTASPNTILSVTNTGLPVAPADLAAGASFVTTTTFNLTITGTIYVNGYTFLSGTTGATQLTLNGQSTTATYQIYENCTVGAGTGGSGNLVVGNAGLATTPQRIDLFNTTVQLPNAASTILVKGNGITNWLGGSLTGTAPTSLFAGTAGTWEASEITVRDVDLSLIGAAKSLVNLTNTNGPTHITFANVKVSASLGGVTTGTQPGIGGVVVDFVISDSTGAVTREEHYDYAGNIVQDTTVTRTGGASDGTTAKSWRVTTNANAARLKPLVSPYIVQWIASGTKTCTVQIATNNVTLQDLDTWLEVEYLGSASTPQGTIARLTNGAALPNVITSSGTNLPTSVVTWNSVPGTPVKQSIGTGALVFNLSGYALFRAYIAKPSLGGTYWIDPIVTCV